MSGTDPEAGFTFVDRRRRAAEDAGPAPEPASPLAGPPPRPSPSPSPQAEPRPAPPLGTDEPRADFPSLCVMLYSEALVHLGQVPDPETGEAEPDFPRARLTIDMLAMLREKTQGNRTPEESALLDEIVTTLRMGFVQLTRRA